MTGYTGQILHVNLTDGTFEIEHPSELFYRTYVGGSCMGAYYTLKNVPKGADPFGPENTIVFSVGPLAGMTISGTSRLSVTTKSPLTGTIGTSESGGYWAPSFKWAGFDAVVIKGKAKKPCYLWIHDGEFELRDAAHIWGKTTSEAQQRIRDELGDQRIRVAQCGPAGETLSMYGNIVNELAHFNGRGGLGSVMGAKNLRAIAVKGNKKPELFDKDVIMAMARKGGELLKNDPGVQSFKVEGTSSNVMDNAIAGGMPSLNWQSGVIEGQELLYSDAWNEAIIKPGTCYACVQSCKRHVHGSKTDEVDPKYGGPEYETMCICGPAIGIVDKVAICKINETTAKYAMDSISFGGTVSFLMECYERGLIDKEFTGGLELTFGNIEAVLELAELTGKGEGFGKFVALGSARCAKSIGRDSEDYLAVVKKREFPAHMPQTKASLALAYALTPFGADHVTVEMDPGISAVPITGGLAAYSMDRAEEPGVLSPEKAKLFWRTGCAYAMCDTMGLCVMPFIFGTLYSVNDAIDMINAATGWDTNLLEMNMAAERSLQLMRAFNCREGFNNDDDQLPKKLYTPLKGGPTDGVAVIQADFEKARSLYYEFAGWTGENGAPSEARLRLLNLEWVMDFLAE